MSSRRRFLQQASTAGLVWSANSLSGRLLSAQTPATADQTTRIYMNSRRTIAPLERNLFGSFLEHLRPCDLRRRLRSCLEARRQ